MSDRPPLLMPSGILHVDQMIPSGIQGTDFMVAVQPVEAVQLQPGGRVDVVNCELAAALAVEQHQGAQFFLG